MKVFKISLKEATDRLGLWSVKKENSVGYFAKLEGSDVFTGYLEDTEAPTSLFMKYIKGVYMEKENKLILLKTHYKAGLTPILYSFPDLSKNGVWSKYVIGYSTFFLHGRKDGFARVTIEEVTENTDRFEKRIMFFEEIYAQVLEGNFQTLKIDLIENIEKYKCYLDLKIPE